MLRHTMICAFLLLAGPAVAQVATPAAQADAVWWSSIASEAITALSTVLVAAVPIIGAYLVAFIRSKSRLAAAVLSSTLLNKLEAGIIAQIRAEAEKLKQQLPPTSAKAEATASALPPTIDVKQKIVANVQPKIEAAFKETLDHFDKRPGSQAVTDMILGRVDAALAKPELPPLGAAARPV